MFLNKHNLHVEITGPKNGMTVVLLHDGLGSVRRWRWQVPMLAEAGYHVVTYDRWGYGESDDRPGLDVPYFKTDLDDLHGLLERLDLRRVALVGQSDGGTVALYYAIQQPERVSCLVTIAAHIYVEHKMGPGMLEIRQAFEKDERFRKSMQSYHGDKFKTVFYNWFDGWHRVESVGWDMRPVITKIACPALIVQGIEDEYATPQHAMDIASSIQEAELWLLPKAKHMLPQDNYADLNPRILRFLKDHANVGN